MEYRSAKNYWTPTFDLKPEEVVERFSNASLEKYHK